MKRDLSQLTLKKHAMDSIEDLERFALEVIDQSKVRCTNQNEDKDANYVFKYI
jgi:hypothetical protein